MLPFSDPGGGKAHGRSQRGSPARRNWCRECLVPQIPCIFCAILEETAHVAQVACHLIVIRFQFQMQKVATISNTYLKIKDWSNVVSLIIFVCTRIFLRQYTAPCWLTHNPTRPPSSLPVFWTCCSASVHQKKQLCSWERKYLNYRLKKMYRSVLTRRNCRHGCVCIHVVSAIHFRLGSLLLSSNWSSGWRLVDLKSRNWILICISSCIPHKSSRTYNTAQADTGAVTRAMSKKLSKASAKSLTKYENSRKMVPETSTVTDLPNQLVISRQNQEIS